MLTRIAYGDSRLSFWPRVREFAVPPSMIEKATARRHVGDWAGACAAAGIDVGLDLRRLARTHGREPAASVRTDLRRPAPDPPRWRMPRIAAQGLRPGLTLTPARYPVTGHDRYRPLDRLLGAAVRFAASGSGAGDDYSYGRPSRRSAGIPGALLPGLRRRPRPGVVAVLTDGQTPRPSTRPPCRPVVGLFPRSRPAGHGEDDPGCVPDTPSAWARVVTIG